MKNDKLLFKFPYHGIDNYDFINDLSNNYKEDIYIEGNITFISIFYWFLHIYYEVYNHSGMWERLY